MHIPIISIVVPVYNVENYLTECIESILSQTFTDFELILIDDGSKDGSLEICNNYAKKDDRIIVQHHENKGICYVRNESLGLANGRYLAFIDSDDYVKPSYLNDLYTMLPEDKSKHGITVCGIISLSPDGKTKIINVPTVDFTSKDRRRILPELQNKGVMYACAKLYDMQLIRKHHFSFNADVAEDMFFMLDYMEEADFLIIRPINNYVYRMGYSNGTLSTTVKSFDREFEAFEEYIKRVDRIKGKYNLSDNEIRETHKSLTIFLHKIILAIYKSSNNYNLRTRIGYLRKALTYRSWIMPNFSPSYLVDKIGKTLLCYVSPLMFDLWTKFLLAIDFKKMFGAENRKTIR